jgi:Putative Ig domain/FG-GAP-like repeat
MKISRRFPLFVERLDERLAPAFIINITSGPDLGVIRPMVGLTLIPATLPLGVVGSTYDQTIVASGAPGPFTFSVTSGTLPAGLSLSPSGHLTGMPTTPSTTNFTITATDSASDSGSQAYSVTVYPAMSLSPLTLPNGAIGTAYNQTITASGPPGPYNFSVTTGTLPAGLSLSADGHLTGMPTTVGKSTFTITATDNFGDFVFQSYTVKITLPLSDVLAATGDGTGNMTVFNPNTNTKYLTFRPFDTAASKYVSQMSIALGDVNGDGVPDLIVATRGKRAGKVKAFDGAGIETGSVTLPTQTIFTVFPITGYTQGLTVASADVNGDGIDDVIAAGRKDPANGNAADVVVYAGGNGTFGSLIGSFHPFTSSFTGGVYVAARSTGSGKAEIAVSSSSNSSVQLWQLSGSAFGQLGSSSPFSTATFSAGAGDGQIAAVDNGGTIEFVTGHVSGGVTTLKLLDAGGNTLDTHTVGTGASFFAIDAIDLSQSGNDDVMFAPVTSAGGTTIDLLNPTTDAVVGTLNSFFSLTGKVTISGS